MKMAKWKKRVRRRSLISPLTATRKLIKKGQQETGGDKNGDGVRRQRHREPFKEKQAAQGKKEKETKEETRKKPKEHLLSYGLQRKSGREAFAVKTP